MGSEVARVIGRILFLLRFGLLHCFDHLARMWPTAPTAGSSRTVCMAELVAWHALKCLGEPAFLSEAHLRDPESLWTRPAEELVSQMQERS